MPTRITDTGLLRTGARLGAAAAVLGALVAMVQPLALASVDYTGRVIPCGRGFHTVHDVAGPLDRFNLEQHTLGGAGFIATDYTGQCNELVAHRRAASAVSGAAGVVTLAALVALALRQRRSETASMPTAEPARSLSLRWNRTDVAGAYPLFSSHGPTEIR